MENERNGKKSSNRRRKTSKVEKPITEEAVSETVEDTQEVVAKEKEVAVEETPIQAMDNSEVIADFSNTTNEGEIIGGEPVEEAPVVATAKKSRKKTKKEPTVVVEEAPVVEEPVVEESKEVIPEPEETPEAEEQREFLVLETEKDKIKREKKTAKLQKKADKKAAKQEIKRKKNLKKQVRTYYRFNVDPLVGLSDEQVSTRIDEGLVNTKKTGSTKTIGQIIIGNVFTFFNLLTLAIAAWLISIFSWTDLFFLVIITANVVIGIIQEIKAKNTIDRLSLISAPTAMVRRDGVDKEISVSELVLDDILSLENGKQICSDSIVLEGTVEVNESLLTGESNAILKRAGDVLYSGSFVVSGRCLAKVDKIGKDNYIETLADKARQYRKPQSELMKTLKSIILFMAFIIIPIGGALFWMQFIRVYNDLPVNEIKTTYEASVKSTAGAMVGMIPSGLYLLTSVALAVGVIKLSQNNVLVQELYCIEMLARVNCLCLDKTGTITDGTMSVKSVAELNPIEGLSTRAVVSAMLNALNDSNMTSTALEEYFGRGKRLKHVSLIPFSSQRKYSAVSFEKYGTFMLGAPEFILKEGYDRIKKQVNEYAGQGYRILLLAHKQGTIVRETMPEGEVDIMSLILIEDNVRPDAVDTISYFKRSGVEVKVISGDNPITVSKISERAGIDGAYQFVSLDGMDDADVVRAATKYTVFGRVSPEQKRLLVQTLRTAGKCVAMTGDGVNDILALKEADCSIAVASGSEAARNVSHLVLLDNNFGSMPKVVAEGRRVINNVAGVASLFLTKTIFSFLLAIQALNNGGVYPITPKQLIIIDFFCIGIPSFILVLEPNNREVEGKFLANIMKGALPGALVVLINALIVFSLVDRLNLNSRAVSTIIVIIATHTCMMVLFKICKPFNFLRKCLCGVMYSMFLLLIFLVPTFFEFSPIIGIADYYDDDYKVETVDEWLDLSISKDDYYVIDGYVTDFQAVDSSGSYACSSSEGYLTINGTKTDYQVIIPNISVTAENYYVLNGTITTLVYSTNQFVTVNSKGSIIIKENATDTGKEIGYSILPTVTIGSDGKYVVNGLATKIQALTNKISSITVNSSFQLMVNGSVLVNTDAEGVETPYTLDKPTLSYNTDNYLVIGGSTSTVLKNSAGDDPALPAVITVLGDKYFINEGTNSYDSSVNIIRPVINITEANHYVIDGAYTEYKASGDLTLLNQSVTSDGYYKINDTVTNIKAEISTHIGGQVQRLPLSGILLMLVLCLAAAPMMKILVNLVPWIKRQLNNIQIFISKI